MVLGLTLLSHDWSWLAVIPSGQWRWELVVSSNFIVWCFTRVELSKQCFINWYDCLPVTLVPLLLNQSTINILWMLAASSSSYIATDPSCHCYASTFECWYFRAAIPPRYQDVSDLLHLRGAAVTAWWKRYGLSVPASTNVELIDISMVNKVLIMVMSYDGYKL